MCTVLHCGTFHPIVLTRRPTPVVARAQGEAATLQVAAANPSAWLPLTAGTAFQLEDAAWTRDRMPSFAKHLLPAPSTERGDHGAAV